MTEQSSPNAIAWAHQEAARIEAAPSRYLNDAEETAFRWRLFGRPTSASGIPLTRRTK